MAMKQVLIINITRMGDLVQMGLLLARLQEEWPGVAVDLIVDRRFAPVAAMLSVLRHIIACDFHQVIDESRAKVKDVVALYHGVVQWAYPLTERRYDRVINLTFNTASALLAGYVGAPDIRGARSAWDGGTVIDNPWMSYFTDMHYFRQINRFNLVDVYALGGSGPGACVPLKVTVSPRDEEWARRYLERENADYASWIAVQAGASDVMKAWRPQHFGRALSCLGAQWDGGIVFLGGESERDTIGQVVQAYRSAGGRCPVKNAAGQTTIEQVAALLADCRLLLTNDTGPMHLAVAVGTPVVDLSVGHVDFRETGPYGPGHWVLQPDLECATCGFDQVCAHHACKDRLQAEQVAELLLHVLGRRAFPTEVSGYRLYQSGIDEDQLGTFDRRAGYESAETVWYAAFWRRYWYETFTGTASHVPAPEWMPPHADEAVALLKTLAHQVDRAWARAEQIVQAAARHPVDAARLQTLQRAQSQEREALARMGMSTLMTRPVTTAFLRTIQNDNVQGVKALAQYHAWAYRQWHAQLTHLSHALDLCDQGAPRKVTMLPMSRQACAG